MDLCFFMLVKSYHKKNKKFITVLVTSTILLLKFINTFYNYFLKSKVKNCQGWYLLGRTSGGFCDVDLHFLVVILHIPLFVDVFHFVVVSSFDFQANLLCYRYSTLVS